MTKAEQYIQDVLSGKIITGELIKLACKRHLDDLKNGHKRGLYFDPEAAQRVIQFFNLLIYHKGELAGKPMTTEPWQEFILWVTYGWKRKDGTRRFRSLYVEVARKNFKTGLLAGCALYGITGDGEQGAQIFCGATKEEQAMILVNDAGQIAKRTKALSKRLKFKEHGGLVKRVIDPVTGSFIAPLGRDSDTQDGFDPHYGIMDERHAHKTNDVSNVIESGMGARKQPLLASITTAGFNRTYPCYAIRKTGSDILKGKKTDDASAYFIYALDDEDNWEDEKVWGKANPNLGVSVKVDFLRDQFIKAKNEGASTENNFKTKNLNIWTNSVESWVQDEKFMACKGVYPDLTGIECYGGLDLASVKDFTAYSLVFNIGGKKYYKFFFWIPEDTAEAREKDGIPIRDWIRDGFVKTTPGNVTDYDFVMSDIMRLKEQYNIISSAYDRHNATQLVLNLIAAGLKMNPFSQAVTNMSVPTKEFEKDILSVSMIHDGNPVFRWMMENVMIYYDSNGNIKMHKGKSEDKIDGPVSAVMALGELMTAVPQTETFIEAW